MKPTMTPHLLEKSRRIQAGLGPHAQGELLVKLNPDHQRDHFVADYGVQVAEQIAMPASMQSQFNGSLLRLSLPAELKVAEAMALMGQDPRVAYAVPNDLLKAVRLPEGRVENLPGDLDKKLWGMKNRGQEGGKAGADIHAGEAWAVHTGSRNGPVVAVVDTGCDLQHPNLKNNLWTNAEDGTHGYNAIKNSHDPSDDEGHGSHCSGTIAAEGQDGVYGVNWQARVMPIKFLDAEGGGKTSDAIKGIAWAAEHGARICSNSWGGSSFNQALYDTLASSPMLHFCAAGNDNQNSDALPFFPAGYELPNVVAVASTDRRDQLSMFSNYGAHSVHVAAPGSEIYSTVPGGQYETLDGTSMAAPHVAGAATLIASAYPSLSNEQLKSRILYNADPVPGLQGKVSSGGRLNLAGALRQDEVAPQAPGAPRAEVLPGSVRLNWTTPLDDQGPVAEVRWRYSEVPIGDGPGEVPWSQARPLVSLAKGEQVEALLPFTEQPRTLYFAAQSLDRVGNASPLAACSGTQPAVRMAFEDRKDPADWRPDGQWGLEEVAGRGSVWTDSPNTDYGNEMNSSLTSRPISLKGLTSACLRFDEKHLTELNYDNCYLEVSRDGNKWDQLDRYTGFDGWRTRQYDLGAYLGAEVRVRFRLLTDNSGPRPGVYFDKICIAGQPDGT